MALRADPSYAQRQWRRCMPGEIDWWELPPSDLLEQLAHDRDITVISQYATAVGILRFNHLHPPFSNVARCGEHCSALSIRPRR
jgi:hypothetical protein